MTSPAHDRLRTLLEDGGFRGLVVLADSSRDVDVAPLVASCHVGRCAVVFPVKGEPLLAFLTDMEREEAERSGLEPLGPSDLGGDRLRALEGRPGLLWEAVLEQGFAAAGDEGGEWALAGHAGAGGVAEAVRRLSASGRRSFGDGGELLRRWRKRKSARASQAFERPSEAVRIAFREISSVLRAADWSGSGGPLEVDGRPLTTGGLRSLIARIFAAHRLEQPHGNLLAQGAEAGVPHNAGEDDTGLRAGAPIVVDLFPRGEVYADCTRTFCVGQPAEVFVEAHAAVRRALEAAHRECRIGARGWELQEQTCALLESAGYPTIATSPETRRGYVHGLGHGVGYELHEYPSFRERAGEVGRIEEGDVLTLEPGLYDAEAGYGVRLEDLCRVTADGLDNLTDLPYEYDPNAWR